MKRHSSAQDDPSSAPGNGPDGVHLLAAAFEFLGNGVGKVLRHHENVADPHVEDAQHFIWLHRAGRLQEALEAYDRTLAVQPEHADARYNRDLVAQALERGGSPEQREQYLPAIAAGTPALSGSR